METNYFIIPGYGNSGPQHWQTFFENALPNCKRIHQQDWNKPICNDWVSTINRNISPYSPRSVVLISHSLGGIAIAHWAQKFKTAIKGAFIVAPPDIENPYQDLSLQSFTPIPLIPLPFPSIVVASTNDYWVTKVRAKLFADHWGSQFITIENAGHINATSGFGNWNDGLELLKKL